MSEKTDPNSLGNPRRRLEALAIKAQDRSARSTAELERRRDQSAGPGDLFVLPATADLPVEWAVLERRSEGGGKLLVVPADTNPLVGSGDVEVGEEALGGPLSLRCRFGIWLDAGALEPELRSGTLAPETVAAALARYREAESGSLTPSSLAEEVDADSEYREWIREVPQRARDLAADRPRPTVKRFPSPFREPAYALAAIFALATIGLSFWVVRLRSEVNLLSVPVFDPPSADIVLGQDVRGGIVVEVARGDDHVQLNLAIDLSSESQNGYLEIVRWTGESVWRSPLVRLLGEYPLVLPRKLLPDGDYQIRVYPESDSAPPLATERLRVQSAD